MDVGELDLVRATLRHVLDSHPPADVPAALLEAGWAELVAAEPAAAISVVSEEAGRSRSAAPVTDLAILWGAGLEPAATTAVVIEGIALCGAERAARFVWLHGDRLTEVDAAAATLSPARGFDPALGLTRVTADPQHGEAIAGAAAVERAVAAGRRALAAQMVGTVEQMLAETLDYVSARHQYGRAIGSFQTVKHRLADVKVAVAAARAAVTAAWEASDTPDAGTAAIAAKCLAGRAQQLASTHCFQVHGGIAFSVEHGFQQWVRRGLLLDFLLGGHEQLTTEVGRRILASGKVPRMPALTSVLRRTEADGTVRQR